MLIMAIMSKKNKTEQQAILDSCEDAKEYYEKVLEAKKIGAPWAEDIPCDLNVLWAMEGQQDRISQNEYIYNQKVREDMAKRKQQ